MIPLFSFLILVICVFLGFFSWSFLLQFTYLFSKSQLSALLAFSFPFLNSLGFNIFLGCIYFYLLKSNSQTIRFTHFECTIQWFGYIYKVVQHLPRSNSRISCPPKESPHSLAVIPHSLAPVPGNNSLSVVMGLSIQGISSTLNGFIWYVVFCVWLISIIMMFLRLGFNLIFFQQLLKAET